MLEFLDELFRLVLPGDFDGSGGIVDDFDESFESGETGLALHGTCPSDKLCLFSKWTFSAMFVLKHLLQILH